MPAFIGLPPPSLSCSLFSFPPSLIHLFIFSHSTPLFSFFLSSSFLYAPHFLPVVPGNQNKVAILGLFKPFQGSSTSAAAAAGCVAMETVL